MAMHNPPHPGEFIADIYLEPNGIGGRELAKPSRVQILLPAGMRLLQTLLGRDHCGLHA